jgi:hypothetical protein
VKDLYTKNGEPVQRQGDAVFSRSGKQVGRIEGNKVYGPNGRYVATIDGGRLVYRSTDSAWISRPFAPSQIAPSSAGRVVGVAIWGDEPTFAD